MRHTDESALLIPEESIPLETWCMVGNDRYQGREEETCFIAEPPPYYATFESTHSMRTRPEYERITGLLRNISLHPRVKTGLKVVLALAGIALLLALIEYLSRFDSEDGTVTTTPASTDYSSSTTMSTTVTTTPSFFTTTVPTRGPVTTTLPPDQRCVVVPECCDDWSQWICQR
ncbi:hypothetical protein [Candidiatus Paracoxiella cheracis]|uniref:hypothetical protein n=1 Tax=Candidiatus Paracoxiella cheracis TaxID=3405120 RepID=UPI003BF5623D